ncbi:MAG: hypothetical protein EOP50_06080 [Sphingobacteriales bacterium]|nr:MAG: hypothetical protein EOP50_06080 [Sphingobacteriales bacterium]
MKAAGTFFLKRDQIRLGLGLGIIAPLLVLLLIYLFRFRDYSLNEFLLLLLREKSLITFFGAWCIVGNIALFTYYTNTRRHATARGIFIVTVVYGIGVLLAKAIM